MILLNRWLRIFQDLRWGSCKNALKRNEHLLLDIVEGKKDGPLNETIKALGAIRSSKAIEPLTELWTDSDLKRRKEIVEALGNIGGANVIIKLIELNDTENNDEIHELIYMNLNKVKAKEESSESSRKKLPE